MNEHLKRSRKQEKRGAKLYNGTVNAGSGNRGRKNDVRTDDWSVEFKTTLKDSYGLKLAELQVAERHAILEHRKALFGIDFAGRESGTSRYVVISEFDLLGVLRDLEESVSALATAREELYLAERALWSSSSESN